MRAVVVRGTRAINARLADGVRRALAPRWPDAEVAIVDGSPLKVILSEADRFKAGVIVLGSRGHGALRRMVTRSVSHGVVGRAMVPVLVVRARRRHMRSLLIGFDGSVNARRATRFVARLAPARGNRVTLLQVVEPMTVPSAGRLPRRVRDSIRHEVEARNARQSARARRELRRRARALREAGWRVRATIRSGIPVRGLLAAATAGRADVVVVGARGAGPVRRMLLGSVAAGVLARSPVPVLIVR